MNGRSITISILAAGFMVLLPMPSLAGGGGFAHCPESAEWNSVVMVLDSCFRPQELKVESGTVVRWEQNGSMPHTVTFDSVDSGTIRGSWSARFNQPGTYTFYCKFHGGPGTGMFGTVVVEGAQLEGPAIEPLTQSGVSIDPVNNSTVNGQTVETASSAATARIQEVDVQIRISPASALVLGLIGFSIGAGATVVARVGRR